MTLNDEIISMETLLSTAKKEVGLLVSGNKSSASRARKSLQEIKTSAHTLRKAIMEHHHGMPVKKRGTFVEAMADAVEDAKSVDEVDVETTPEPPIKKTRKAKKKTPA